jgi:rhomboid protease GluP
MFRKTSGAILCPSCGRLTNADAPACLVCGRRNPGMWGFAGPLHALFRRYSFVDVITVACVILYVVSLVIDPGSGLQRRGGLSLFAPSNRALLTLGATGAFPWSIGHWWTVLTAIYLHGDIFHILLNVLAIRQLGPAVEELYGSSRLVVIFTVAGAVGFIASNVFGHVLTLGASGSAFGLLGAIVAFGQKRGGTFGSMIVRQYGMWALLMFALSFMMAGVNNVAHGGGFVGGFVAGHALALAERRRETGFDQLLATIALALTLLGFVLAVWSGVV